MIIKLVSAFLVIELAVALILECRFFTYSYYDSYRYLISLSERIRRKPHIFLLSLLFDTGGIILTLIVSIEIGLALLTLPLFLWIYEVPKVKVRFTRKNLLQFGTALVILSATYLLFIKLSIYNFLSCAMTVFTIPLLVFVSFLMLYPLEYSIQGHYIKSARKKLNSNPKLKIIGVTGSFGKTTFKNCLKTLLSQERVLCSPGNVNTPNGLVKFINDKLTPLDDYLILEMGIDRIKGMKRFKRICSLDYAVITAVGPQHLRTMRTLDNIYRAKTDIVTLLKPTGKIVYCRDTVKPSLKLREPKIEYGEADYYLQDNKCIKTLRYGSVSLKTHLQSISSVNHAFGAYLLSRDILKNKGDLEQRFAEISETSRRKKLSFHNNMLIIDDSYNINPYSAAESFEMIKKYTGKRGVVTSGLVELGKRGYTENYKFGYHLAEFDLIIYVGRKIKKSVLAGYKAHDGDENKIIRVKKASDIYRYTGGLDVLLLFALGDAFTLD